jgi:hypothetical protein
VHDSSLVDELEAAQEAIQDLQDGMFWQREILGSQGIYQSIQRSAEVIHDEAYTC